MKAKKYPILWMLLIGSAAAFAQPDGDTLSLLVKDIQIDLLKSPTNPAFLLMGTSPVEVVEPGSAPEFYASIQKISNNFSVLPNNFGFSVTPYWWGKQARQLSFDHDFDTLNRLCFYRTLSLSGGVVKGAGELPGQWRYGIGFSATLLRGRVDPLKKQTYLSELRHYHDAYFGALTDFYRQSPEYLAAETERISITLQVKALDSLLQAGAIGREAAQQQKTALIAHLMLVQQQLKALEDELSEEFNARINTLPSTAGLDARFNDMNRRTGLKWDVGAGAAIRSEYNALDSTHLYRAGLWTDLGGNLISPDSTTFCLSGFLLARYFYYDEIYYRKDEQIWLINGLHTLDVGARLNISAGNKFSLAFEGVYRNRLSGDIYESTYRLNGMVQYEFLPNKLVYTSVGNAFNDESGGGPEMLMVTFGVNIGIGGNVDLYGIPF